MSRRNPTPEDWAANSLPFEKALSLIELDYPFLYDHFFNQLLRDALHIFEVKNVPESIKYDFMKLCIVILGRCAFFDKFENKLLAMNCAPSGKPNLVYIPQNILITNPRFQKSFNLKLGEECEVVYCTSMDPYYWGRGSGGLYSLICTTASLLADNYLSLNIAQKNLRLTNAFAADDQNTVESLTAAMEDAYNGKPFLVVQKSLIDKLETLPMTNTSDSQTLIQMLDIHKYILSEFYAVIGLQESQQMKRERLITAEVEDGAELPLFNIQDMLQTLQDGFQRVNAMFGTEMQIEVNPLILRNLYGDQNADDQSAGEPEDVEPAEEPEEAPKEPETVPEDVEPAELEAAAADLIDAAAELIEAADELIEEKKEGDQDAEADQ